MRTAYVKPAVFFLVFTITGGFFAQEKASVVWNCTNTDSARALTAEGPVTGFPVTGKNIWIRDYAGVLSGGGGGPLGPFQRWWLNANWPDERVENPDRYIQFAACPKAGYTLTLSSVVFILCAKSTSGMKVNLDFSTDSMFTVSSPINTAGVLSLSPDVAQEFSYTINTTIHDGETFDFRIYPWLPGGSTNTGKYVMLQRVVFSGVAVPSNSGFPLSVTTADASGISFDSATCGGNVVSDGGKPVTDRGICWSTNHEPTAFDFKTSAGAGTGSFTVSMTGLAPRTTYYVRAYAVNTEGTAYGSEVSLTTSFPPIAAFPGAEGYGRYATGGRGGKVIEVTTIEDHSEPGSLRYAINQSGSRTIVFRVSGTVELKSKLTVKNGDITLAGQTAPGDGICLKNYPFSIDADNVIIRYIRVRVGNGMLNKPGDEYDAATGIGRKNIILDHCTFSWANDEVASFYDNTNFTMQWCIVSESFYHSTHSKGDHGYGGIWGGLGATFHHNLLAHHTSRNPRFNGSRYHGQPQREIVDFVNNVIYNWGSNSAYGGEEGNQNVRANYYKSGPSTGSGVKDRIVNPTQDPGTGTSYGKFYVADNFVYGSLPATQNNWAFGVQGISAAVKDTIQSNIPFPIAEVRTQSTDEAYGAVLSHAGASFPKRDSVDARVVREARNGTAQYGTTYRGGGVGIIDSQSDVGGYPALNSLPAPQDSDHDGIPDSWETTNGLNPNDPSDALLTDAVGYTNLETYLNGLAAGSSASVRDRSMRDGKMPAGFILEPNYPNPFNPSTTLSYTLPASGRVEVKIFDTHGETIRVLQSGILNAGVHRVTWDGRDACGNPAGTGVYLGSVWFLNQNKTVKLLLVK